MFRILKNAFLGALILSMGTLAGCLSYSYTGLVDTETLPSTELIGLSYNEVVLRYGAPSRVVPLSRSRTPSEETAGGQESQMAQGAGQFLVVYKQSSSHQVLLYQRQRSTNFVLTVENGRVVAFQSSLAVKSDGLSLGLGDLVRSGAQGGGQGSDGGR